MRTTPSLIYLTALLMLCACAVSETETLKQARSIQQEIEQAIAQTDSGFAAYSNRLSGEINALSSDTLLQEDTTKRNQYNHMKLMLDSANLLHAQLVNWKSGMKRLPTAEEIAKGAGNPFGEGADDKAALDWMMKQEEEFNAHKQEIMRIIYTDSL